MSQIKIADDTPPSENIQVQEIDGTRFFLVKNIMDYSFCCASYCQWNVTVQGTSDTEPTSSYFIIDTCHQDAFGHWIYESLGHLHTFQILKKSNKEMKLVLKERKTYKSIVCKYFGIEESDIVYSRDFNFPNIAYIPSPITSINYQDISQKNRSSRMDDYYTKLYTMLNNTQYEDENTIDYAILPRQQKENIPVNDRVVSYTKILEYFKGNSQYTSDVINTDDITDFGEQIRRVRRAKTVIVNDGSAFVVNAIFCKEKLILINQAVHTRQHSAIYPMVKKMLERIEKRNTLLWFMNENELLNYIQESPI